MKQRKPLVWPPKVGQRICRDYGPGNLNNFSAEVRAIVDDDYAVIARWRPGKGFATYEILDRFLVATLNSGAPCVFEGHLPRASRPRPR